MNEFTAVMAACAAALSAHTHELQSNLSFLELGGDSIQAGRVVAELNEAGFKVRLVDVIEATSLDDLASRVRAN